MDDFEPVPLTSHVYDNMPVFQSPLPPIDPDLSARILNLVRLLSYENIQAFRKLDKRYRDTKAKLQSFRDAHAGAIQHLSNLTQQMRSTTTDLDRMACTARIERAREHVALLRKVVGSWKRQVQIKDAEHRVMRGPLKMALEIYYEKCGKTEVEIASIFEKAFGVGHENELEMSEDESEVEDEAEKEEGEQEEDEFDYLGIYQDDSD